MKWAPVITGFNQNGKIMIRCFFFLLLLGPLRSFTQEPAGAAGFSQNHIVGIDQFGRSFQPIGGYQQKKQVGIFYWPWIGQPYASGIYDATKISALPDGLKLLYDFKHQNDSISPNGQAHFWGEPLWGYYNSEDEWVIRRQLKMLMNAGIDFIVFDLTNRVTYRSVYEKVLRTIGELIAEGWSPPRAVFYTHSKSFETVRQLFKDLYQPGLYPQSWYRVNGKPMIIAYTDTADDRAEAVSRGDTSYHPVAYSNAIQQCFYFKKPQWPFDPVYSDGFPWIEWTFPQPLHGGIMNVTVASHPKVPMSRSITSGWVNWGRGWDPDTKQNRKEDIDKGGFFQRQWDHALKVNPDTVFVGGWNEWIAYKQPYGDEYMLCDAANREYSRDIEPMQGGYGDAFYIQLIKNIRAYKGIPDTGSGQPPVAIDPLKSISQWAQVKAIYKNPGNEEKGRDAFGASKKVRYIQPPPANSLREIRVAHDAGYFYFLISADKPFVQDVAAGGVELFIGSNAPERKGWNGYEEVVTMDIEKKQAVISRLDASGKRSTLGKALLKSSGVLIQLCIPRDAIKNGASLRQFYFKAAAGIRKNADIMDYYTTGSAMPMGRLSYLYRLQK